MKPKTMILMMVAIGCGLVAALLVKNLAARGPSEENTDTILVAKTELKPGNKIGDNIEGLFEKRQVAKGLVMPGTYTLGDIEAKPEKVVGKTVVKTLGKGEALTEKHLTDESITKTLKPGYRAMAIPVSVDRIAAGFVLPGSRVDLITQYTLESKSLSKIFLQNIEVLALNQETKPQEGQQAIPNAATALLALLPKQAAQINWAIKQGGTITMALRSPTDSETVKSRDTTVSGIGGGSSSDVDEEETESVLVARHDIDKDEDLKGKDLAEYFEEKRVPKGLFSNETYVKTLKDESLKDTKIKSALKRGDVVARVVLGESKVVATPEAPKPPETFTQTIFNGSRDPIQATYTMSGANVTMDRRDVIPPAPAPGPAKEATPDKGGSEGK